MTLLLKASAVLEYIRRGACSLLLQVECAYEKSEIHNHGNHMDH